MRGCGEIRQRSHILLDSKIRAFLDRHGALVKLDLPQHPHKHETPQEASHTNSKGERTRVLDLTSYRESYAVSVPSHMTSSMFSARTTSICVICARTHDKARSA